MATISDKKTQCEWVEDEGWETACGEMFMFETEGPLENGFLFCPYCGRGLITPEKTQCD